MNTGVKVGVITNFGGQHHGHVLGGHNNVGDLVVILQGAFFAEQQLCNFRAHRFPCGVSQVHKFIQRIAT